MQNTSSDSVRSRFLAPIAAALNSIAQQRLCPAYSDAEHLATGIGRGIASAQSGRDWVQSVQMTYDGDVSVGNFFDALRSARRTACVAEVAQAVHRELDCVWSKAADPLAQHPELDGFAVYACDGHTHAASAHAPLRQGEVCPVTHIFNLNLRSHSMGHLAQCAPARQKAEHEITTLKRLGGQTLRMGARTGRKVLLVYDPAIVDYPQWYKWKQAAGVYILTLEKANSALTTLADLVWDRRDPRNAGVLSDELVGPANGVTMRRIRYQDPADGALYTFLTNELTLPPGLLALLYKLRWNIEKVFDQVKNKFGEQKAWATTTEAQCQQAAFITLAHNLTLRLERILEAEEAITDQKAQRKRAARLAAEQARAQAAGRTFNAAVAACQRLTQRSLQFLRWLRYCLQHLTSWSAAVARLRPLMQHYLT